MSKQAGFVLDNPYDFLTRFLPGAFFAGHAVIVSLCISETEALMKDLLDKPLVFIFAYSIFALLCGMLFENWGSYLECLLMKRDVRKNLSPKNERQKIWDKYLQTEIDGSPVGHRYLRTLVIRVKFSLGMLVAAILSGLLIIFAFFKESRYCESQYSIMIVLLVVNVFLGVVLSIAVLQLMNVLHRTRELVLKSLK